MIKEFALAAALSVAFVGSASAVPMIDFDVSGPGSSADVTSYSGDGFLTASLVPGLDFEMFSLAEGESQSFDFFSLTLDHSFSWWDWADYGDYTVEATLSFDDPTGASASGSGGGWASTALTFFGIVSAGSLTWDDSLPVILATTNGSEFMVDFEDGFAAVFGNTATVQATVTAISVVPLPAALPLLVGGLGLLGFAASRRRKTV